MGGESYIPAREKREAIGCIAFWLDGRPCDNTVFGGTCPFCGGALCARHYEEHLKDERKLVAWRNACAGKAAGQLHVVP